MKTQSLWLTFLPWWVLANGFGWFLVNVFFILPYWGLRSVFAVGFLLSLLQWGVLQKNDLGDSMWIWMSTIPYSIYLFILFLLPQNITFLSFILLFIGCFGLLGLFQRAALAYYVDHATVWIIASPIASILSLITNSYVNNFLSQTINPAFSWTFFGVVYGCITGAVIIFLNNSTAPDEGSIKNPKVIDI